MKRDNGITLIELLIAMVVIVVLLAAAVPSFRQFIKNNRVSGQANELIIALQATRSEAIKRGSGTVICASTDQLTCSGSNNWATGWITFSDHDQDGALDGNGTCTTAADHLSKECILRVNTTLNSVTLTAKDDVGLDVSNIQFLPGGRTGLTLGGMTANDPVTFTLKANNCEYQQQRSITLTSQGHTSSTEDPCS